MFVAYERWAAQWFWVYPGGAERIAEPEHIFVDDEWARAHTLEKPRTQIEKKAVNIRRGKRAAQLVLEL
jgi:hypothetical protein